MSESSNENAENSRSDLSSLDQGLLLSSQLRKAADDASAVASTDLTADQIGNDDVAAALAGLREVAGLSGAATHGMADELEQRVRARYDAPATDNDGSS